MQEAGVGVAGRAAGPRKSSVNQWHSFSKQHIRGTQRQAYILFSARNTVPRLREGYRLAAEAVRLLRCNCCSNNLEVLQLRFNITVRRTLLEILHAAPLQSSRVDHSTHLCTLTAAPHHAGVRT
ncbi:hypothetical protein E2C01_048583 [Portunus trituberculatus]|uniref:Uncharacterized protein n=1 Tax=Portunus trituberculatus TaxID=210409 RepID=A0A5B7G3H2_PORTR|nr:hypothetical protein [Portunus trituberculatus]